MTNQVEYLSVTDTAKLVRKALKAAFPAVKFSVRSSSYAGGASIDVRWDNGPTCKAVDEIVKVYEGKGFDGMIDMAYSKYSFIAADGSVGFASTKGTEGSMGVVSAKANELPQGAKVVRFGSDYVCTSRTVTNEVRDGIRAAWRELSEGERVALSRECDATRHVRNSFTYDADLTGLTDTEKCDFFARIMYSLSF